MENGNENSMKLAIAVVHNSPHAPLSSRFGKANYYAIFDRESLKIHKNPHQSGKKLIQWFKTQNVTHLLLKEVDKVPCALKPEDAITLLYPQTSNPTLQDAIRIFYQIKKF